MNKTILIFLFLVSVIHSVLFSVEKIAVSIVFTNKNQQYVQAVEGFKKFINENNMDLWFTEYNLESKEDKVSSVVQEIKNKRPDIILTVGTLATNAISQNIDDIPIVFCMVLDETSINKKPNITGVLMDIPIDIKCKYLKKILPNSKRIGIIYTKKTEEKFSEMLSYSKNTEYQLIGKKINSEKELPNAFNEILNKIDVFLMISDSTIYSIYSIKYVILQCLQNKVPLFGLSFPYTKAGALFSLDCNYEDIGKQTGEVLLRIFKGEKPYEIKSEIPRKINLSINLITADRLEIKISEEILKETKEVIKNEIAY